MLFYGFAIRKSADFYNNKKSALLSADISNKIKKITLAKIEKNSFVNMNTMMYKFKNHTYLSILWEESTDEDLI